MMNDAFTEKISLWLDDQLTTREVAELETHLVNCEACQETYEALQQAHQFLLAARTQTAAPAPGFTHRFEVRLARHQASQPWQLWLAVAALVLGTLSVFGVWLLAEGFALVSAGSSLLNGQILYQSLSQFIESLAGLQLIFNLGTLLLKTSYVLFSQPLFWGIILMAVSMIGLWLWLMQTLARRTVSLSVL